MDIESEDREEVIVDNKDDDDDDDNIEQNQKQKRVRGRRKKQKQRWEETIEVVLPQFFSKEQNDEEQKEQKLKKKKKQNVEMEIEEYGSVKDNYKDISKQIIGKKDKFNRIFEIIDSYNNTIQLQKSEIQRNNFQSLIQKIINILDSKIKDLPLFLNYIQLLIDKSNLDSLLEFNQQLKCDIESMNEKQKQQVFVIQYEGGNQLFKILTHFKFEVENIISKIKQNKKGKSLNTILCVFDGAYNICKQDMVEIGKFFQEEYNQYQNDIQLVILFPVSQLITIPDIQIYTVEFCKQKELFIKFLLFLLKSEEFPLLPQNLLQIMLNDFDLYSITYNDQVRRIQMALSNFVYEHQDDEDLIKLLQEMQQQALKELEGSDEESDEKNESSDRSQDIPEKKAKNKKINTRSKSQSRSSYQKPQKTNPNTLIDKLDLWTIKKEIKIIIQFLENFYSLNFSNGDTGKYGQFSQKFLDQSDRIIEIVLNTNNYVMTEFQQKEFFKDPNISCKKIQQLLKDFSELEVGNQIFKSHVQTLEDIDNKVKEDIKRQKNQSAHSRDRYARSQQNNKQQSETDITQLSNQMKRDRVEKIVKQITYDLQQAFQKMEIKRLSLDISKLNQQCKPDILGSVMMHKKIVYSQDNKQRNLNKMKKQEIVEVNPDGMYLIHILEQYGKKFTIPESFEEYKSILREKNIELNEEEQLSSYYNAICELRYLGMIEEKRKLKSEFIKHFFAKSSFFQLSIQNS
ncbi:hypothetical protein ABPG74_005425 [Tetrahymena malaccensis]